MGNPENSREVLGWRERFAAQITTPYAAVERIRPGDSVLLGTGCGQPTVLVDALVERAAELSDVEIMHLLAVGDAPYAYENLTRHFSVNTFFVTPSVRKVVQEGLGEYTPIFFSDIPALLDSGQLPLDVALIQVTPPNERGLCSLGVSVDVTKTAAENASLVIAQVNPAMPWTEGDALLSAFDIDILVPVDVPLLELAPPAPTDTSRRIGQFVAALVEDGSTIELGIGRIPQAVAESLSGKKDLGVHTELVTDAIIELVESGVVTGARKTVDRGRIVAGFAMGTKRLYEYLNNNRRFLFRSTAYVNDPAVIARQQRMVAINSALEVDLTGQVSADSLGSTFIAGIGGQADFTRGAARSRDGKAIIALPSTAENGSVSRIVARLSPGGGVVATRGDVHYVVTEHGVAYLHGKSIQERALALISIAEPSFRPGLLHEAIDAKYLEPEFANIENRLGVAPAELRTTLLLKEGTLITIRPVHLTDEPLMKDLFYALSQQTVYYRYMSRISRLQPRQMRDSVYVDYRSQMRIVATIPTAAGEEIIATGGYFLDQSTNRAETAFVVRDDWQGKGVGTFMFEHLVRIARSNGIGGFTAEVLAGNKKMQTVFLHSDLRVRSEPQGDVVHFDMEF